MATGEVWCRFVGKDERWRRDRVRVRVGCGGGLGGCRLVRVERRCCTTKDCGIMHGSVVWIDIISES